MGKLYLLYREHRLMLQGKQKEKRPSNWTGLKRHVKHKTAASGYTPRSGKHALPR
jgi:hypothetical protein